MKNLAFHMLVAAALAACPLSAPADEWATVKGRFLFGGDPPAAADLKADKDVEVCGKHKLVSEEIVVGPDKGVANVVVFVKNKDVKVNPELKPTGPAVLDNKFCRFEPHVVFVQTGQDLVIKNSDTVGHNSNIAAQKNSPSNTLIAAGGESKVAFTQEEANPIAVTCNVHPWMKAWLVVRSNPYAAVSQADGTFEIKGVPVGEVELCLRHADSVYIAETECAKGKTDKKGRITVNVEAGGTDLGDIVLNPALFQK